MDDRLLESFVFNKEFINNAKTLIQRTFLNKMTGLVILSDNSYVITNVKLVDILTNTFTSSCTIHLVESKCSKLNVTLKNLTVFNSDGNYSFLSRDHFISFLNRMEKVLKYYSNTYKKTEEEIDAIFTLTPVRKINGDVVIKFSDELDRFFEIINRLMIETQCKTFRDDEEKLLLENPPKQDALKAIAVLFLFSIEDKKVKKIVMGDTSSHRVVTSFIGTYIDHIQELIINDKNLVIESIKRSAKELNKETFCFYKTTKKINSLFENRNEYTLRLPMMSGINHPVPSIANNEYELNLCMWKEDNSVRHFIKYESSTLDVISFLPFAIFYLYEGESSI